MGLTPRGAQTAFSCPTRIASAAALLSSLACVTGAPAPRMTLAEAGLAPLPARRVFQRQLTSLDAATEVLLATIERQTGERPILDDQPPPEPEDVIEALQGTRAGVLSQRSALSLELLHATERGQATARSIARARAALLWEQALGLRQSDVDEQIVAKALARADSLLGALAPAPDDEQISLSFSASTSLYWPVAPVQVTSRFGVRSDPFGDGPRRHLGLDLAAGEGQPVRSAGDGVVTYAGLRGGYGLHVEVKHPDGYVTRYAHLSVVRGATLGLAGHTGRATGPHLHFEVWRDGVPVNPLRMLPSEPVPLAAR
jgi:murein DD-endopeptidase MepM/ murein hydrolase activator NlpD